MVKPGKELTITEVIMRLGIRQLVEVGKLSRGRLMTIDWNALTAEHSRMVIQTAMRVPGNAADAEDVAQEAFLEVISGK